MSFTTAHFKPTPPSCNIDVVCVLWGTKFSEEYVKILKAAVARNTTVPHRFVCYTDLNYIEGVEVLPLKDKAFGWWNKLELFAGRDPRPANRTNFEKRANRYVYFDLDTIITSNIDWLMNDRHKLIGIEDLGIYNRYEPRELYTGKFQSGVMAWDREYGKSIYEMFSFKRDRYMGAFRGDGEFLNGLLHFVGDKPVFIQREYPGQLYSYKYQAYYNGPQGSITCFHGNPMPHEAINQNVNAWGTIYEPRAWVGDYWRT